VSSRPPGIWWGDAARAVAVLDADPTARRRILTLLGLIEPAAEVTPDAGPPLPVRPSPPGGSGALPLPVAGDVLTAGRARPAAQLEPSPGTSPAPVLERVPSAPAVPPRPLPPITVQPPTAVDLEPADLLAPGRRRAILGALCSGPAATAEVDVGAVVPLLARREPLRTLPMLVRPTTRRGTQLLVDHGPAMTPFARDEDDVRAAITQIVGADGLDVLRFAGTPLDPPGAGSGPLWTWRSYRPRPHGGPVVALTDLGALAPRVDRTATEARWVRFAMLLREAGCPFVALCPAPVGRLPRSIRTAIAVVTWDRATSVRDAVRAARRAGGRAPRSPS